MNLRPVIKQQGWRETAHPDCPARIAEYFQNKCLNSLSVLENCLPFGDDRAVVSPRAADLGRSFFSALFNRSIVRAVDNIADPKYNKSLHPTGLRGTRFAFFAIGMANRAPLRPAGELNRYAVRRTTDGGSGWKSPANKAVAGSSKPSLAGVAVTRGPKRRQGLHEMRKVSHEIDKLAKAERVVYREGSMCTAVMQGGDASPGSQDRIACKKPPLGTGRSGRVRQADSDGGDA